MAVLLELEWRLSATCHFRGLRSPPNGVEPSDPGVAQPAENQLSGDSTSDHLVVDQVGRHARKRQVALALTDDLVACCEADQVGEALDGHCIAVLDELG